MSKRLDRWWIFGLYVLVSMIGGCGETQPNNKEEPLDWEINLDQPIGQLEEVMGEKEQQQHYNYTSANMAFLYDAKLYILFHDRLAAASPDERALLLDTQRSFLSERRAKQRKEYDSYNGGTGGPAAGNLVFIEMTQERIDELMGDDKE